MKAFRPEASGTAQRVARRLDRMEVTLGRIEASVAAFKWQSMVAIIAFMFAMYAGLLVF